MKDHLRRNQMLSPIIYKDFFFYRELEHYSNWSLRNHIIPFIYQIDRFIEYHKQKETLFATSVLNLLEEIKKRVTYFKSSIDDPYPSEELDPLYSCHYKWFEMQYFKWDLTQSEELAPSYSLPLSESEWEERDSQINELPPSYRCELISYWVRGSIFSNKISRNPNIYLSGPKVIKFLRKISEVLRTI